MEKNPNRNEMYSEKDSSIYHILCRESNSYDSLTGEKNSLTNISKSPKRISLLLYNAQSFISEPLPFPRIFTYQRLLL